MSKEIKRYPISHFALFWIIIATAMSPFLFAMVVLFSSEIEKASGFIIATLIGLFSIWQFIKMVKE